MVEKNMNVKSNINWFPGHMKKALNEMQKSVKIVDIVIELVDARAPIASSNPELVKIINNKPHLVILNKSDLADENKTKEFVKYYDNLGINTFVCSVLQLDFKKLKAKCNDILKEKFAKERSKGLKPRPIRALVCGIPNVGKSTFINKVAKRKIANVGNKPGVTKSQQMIKVDKDFELLDTPGVLWPKFEDQNVARTLALIHTIKTEILPKTELVSYLISWLIKEYPNTLNKRYGEVEMMVNNEDDILKIISNIATNRGFIISGNTLDIDRTIDVILKEFADGMLGRFTLEEVKNNG